MEIKVLGRHALLFDDDAMAAFVNSSDALVEWNSIPIDRYDVRHLLSSPPPPRRRLHHIVESDLDQERYRDLYLDLSLQQQEPEDDIKPVNAGGYNAVAFSYGNNEESHKNSDSGLGSSSFCPPFHVPVDVVIPPTEKLHHIIARTAIYVSKHGAQSEIVLRVKQGDNPTFGFLMPDHHLHSYFRFLVDHSEVLHSDAGEKPQSDKISDTKPGVGGGALSLLGSLYGFGEDDDGAVEHALTSEGKASDVAITAHMSEETVSPKSFSNDAVLNHSVNSQDKVPAKPKDKVFVLKKNSLTSGLKAGTGTGSGSGTRKERESFGSHSATADKLRSSSVAPTLMVEPPSEMKKLIAKIVEFIVKNGKQFEAVLIEQDSEHGRFPFLLPSSEYYQYYLKVLQEAQKSKVSGRASLDAKDGLGLHGSSKKTLVSKENGLSTSESAECEIPFDSERKEKFKMVIGKSKNDGLDPPAKASQQESEVGVDAAAAAAILQAATRGIRTPNLDFLSRSSLNKKDNSSEHLSSLGSHYSSQPRSVTQESEQNGARCFVPVVKENARTEAVGEADSLEAHLTREQKLKAERLRRAKMFVAMIKSGSATQIKPESSRGTSLEPFHAGSADAEDNRAVAVKERGGSSAPLEMDATENIESSANKFSDEYNERKARRKYRSNSGKHEDAKDDTDDEEDEVVYKHSRKKHHKEDKGVGEREIKHSRKQHTRCASDCVSEQEDHIENYHRYSRKHHRSRRSSHDRDENDEVEYGDERDKKYSRKHLRSYKSSDGEDDKERKHHRSCRFSHDVDENDEVEHDERDHRYSRKHHRSYKSSNDEDEEECDERRSRKKHRSHQSSHRSRHHSSRDSIGHKHKRRHTSSKDKESRCRDRHNITSEEENVRCIGSDGLSGKVPQSEREDLEEGEISAKASDQSRGSVAGAHREPSVDVSSSFQDQRSSSQPQEPTEVSNDLRAKIRAMLLETL